MENTTRTHPKLKQAILSDLMMLIYRTPCANLEARLNEIVEKNAAISDGSNAGFFYKGESYSVSGKVIRNMRRQKHLAKPLYPFMDEWLKENQELDAERLSVVGFLTTTLNASNNVSDYISLLPECLHSAMFRYSKLQTTEPMLSSDQGTAFQEKNANAVALIKHRLVLNLIQ